MHDIKSIDRRVGSAIRRERRRMGFSQQELAAVVGCDRSLLSHLEHGRAVPTVSVIVRIALALGIDVMRLLPENLSGLGLSQTEIRLVQTYREAETGSPLHEVCRLIAYAVEDDA